MTAPHPFSLQRQPILQQVSGLMEALFGPIDRSCLDGLFDAIAKALSPNAQSIGQRFGGAAHAATQSSIDLMNRNLLAQQAQQAMAARAA